MPVSREPAARRPETMQKLCAVHCSASLCRHGVPGLLRSGLDHTPLCVGKAIQSSRELALKAVTTHSIHNGVPYSTPDWNRGRDHRFLAIVPGPATKPRFSSTTSFYQPISQTLQMPGCSVHLYCRSGSWSWYRLFKTGHSLHAVHLALPPKVHYGCQALNHLPHQHNSLTRQSQLFLLVTSTTYYFTRMPCQ